MTHLTIPPLHLKVAGHYIMEAVAADGTKRFLAEFDNLITNNGLDLMGTSGSWLTVCVVGSGNAIPAYTDTSLQTYVAGTGTIVYAAGSAQPSAPYYGTLTNTYQFSVGAFPSGANLSEVGIAPNDGGGNLFSRALILDGIGNPTTITILATEALNVTYQLRVYVPTADSTGTTDGYSWIARASLATNQGYWGTSTNGSECLIIGTSGWTDASLQDVTGSIQGSELGGPTSTTFNTYTPGSYTNTSNSFWPLAYGNSTDGISGFQLSVGRGNNLGLFQMSVSPPIMKDGTKTLAASFSVTWSRY